ncbi:MAG: family 20 glycosylhydrolase [Eubacteriales bacterium]|nr:family 20 glycosylhydrolase [Eubacteriales bacterium]
MPIPQVLQEKRYAASTTIRRSTALLGTGLEGAREGILAMLAFGADGGADGETAIRFVHNPAFDQEQYSISSGVGGVSVEAGSETAAVWAAATVSQLCFENEGRLPYCFVEDAPRFGWRGLLIDVCRHFFPMETLYRLVDLLAYYKYNRLHLHLSDDQGFRFESERFPLLSRVGSRRTSTQIRRSGTAVQDKLPHGGYYTKHELRALVAYAKARGVEIVPELDMPGHALSILAAYPALGCFDEPFEVETTFGVSDFSRKLLCAGKEETFEFVSSLLEELLEVFPFPYIHIGGDEAVKDNWKRCPCCQRVIHEQGLKDERELEGYFLNRVSRFLRERGRKAIVWNDGLCANLDKDIITQFWTPFYMEGAGRTARRVNAGSAAVMSPFLRVYYDYPYAMTPLKKTYGFEPVLRGIRTRARQRVLGVESAIWTEWIDSEEKLFFNTLPRLAATAETGWTNPKQKRYRDFLRRLQPHYALYDRLKLPYAGNVERTLPLGKRIRGIRTFLRTDTHAELGNTRQEGGTAGKERIKPEV